MSGEATKKKGEVLVERYRELFFEGAQLFRGEIVKEFLLGVQALWELSEEENRPDLFRTMVFRIVDLRKGMSDSPLRRKIDDWLSRVRKHSEEVAATVEEHIRNN